MVELDVRNDVSEYAVMEGWADGDSLSIFVKAFWDSVKLGLRGLVASFSISFDETDCESSSSRCPLVITEIPSKPSSLSFLEAVLVPPSTIKFVFFPS